MFHTFSYSDGVIKVATKVWSDFSGTLPIIRSFSLGDNWPPEYPLFPGEPIRYHFLFYLVMGLIEKAGLRIDWALNLPSALSFTLLILTIYLLAKELFKSRAVGVLSVVFFLFNGSLSFLEFFKKHPLSLNTLVDILHNSTFPSFGPYDGKVVSAFWNLNIYTNQRHLALPFALLLLLVLWIVKTENKKASFPQVVIGGIYLGILPFVHSSIFVMAVLVLGMLFILLNKQRLTILGILILGVLLSLPRVFFLKETASFVPKFELAYLSSHPLTIFSFIKYWFSNLGLSLFLIPIGFLLAPKNARKVFVAFLPLFLIGNLVQFSIEMAGNHKFFNVFLSVANMFTAYTVYKIWKQRFTGKVIAILIIFFLTLSGVIDFFAIKNDTLYQISDYPKNPDIVWIMKNISKNAVFLNSSYLYNPASLAGRKIYFGWPYFAWSLGYDTNSRFANVNKLFSDADLPSMCQTLKNEKINFIEVGEGAQDYNINRPFFEKNFKLIYKGGVSIYDVTASCT